MYASEVLLLVHFAAAVWCAKLSISTGPVVDLGYEVYQGYYNSSSQLNIFKGLRYAAAPTGNLRWMKPQPPLTNRTDILNATEYPSRCPQSAEGPLGTDESFTSAGLGDEDCLFLSVFVSPDADELPVMVWIHGGGYGGGQGNNEFWELLATNNSGFILVLIQYRLGAFGFLSSADFQSHGGVPNVGIHDMAFSLEWIQNHIHRFGGDPARVTISGESAGGGGVMLLAMANGGEEGTSHFTNAIAASPYLPEQWEFDAIEPTQAYERLAREVGCDSGNGSPAHQNQSFFDCLMASDSIALQNASFYVSGTFKYGQWAFLPVTDYDFIRERPSVQLAAGRVNGIRMLTGNNADEGQTFVPQNITSAEDFKQFTSALFPLMSTDNLTRLFEAYAIAPVVPGPLFSTLGDRGPTALNQSEFGTGQQQRANNLYAETTFVCPSYWLANAYSASLADSSNSQPTKAAWKYQFSVPPSEHGADLDAYQDAGREALGKGTMSEAARKAVQLAWGRFIIYDDPTLPNQVITSITTTANGSTTHDDLLAMSTTNWTEWSQDVEGGGYRMLNINVTGGVPETVTWTAPDGASINVTQMMNPGLTGHFRMVDAWSWEAGRGRRCLLWQELGPSVPE